ncbi:hypothetical protein HELRODRAFT_160779 [Helobdella robusta]|uniref:Uncharacterized protein n=1 Tax=Helobdella robusta TaxID=6412 RepID=T1EQQ0_HELRO|nr:hypothetical protein HELRODRAFT_160779 [Helobdella robusta]ESO06592.1 hypothetical protein HELRODRAFT_160779 [Helobdella robusta]
MIINFCLLSHKDAKKLLKAQKHREKFLQHLPPQFYTFFILSFALFLIISVDKIIINYAINYTIIIIIINNKIITMTQSTMTTFFTFHLFIFIFLLLIIGHQHHVTRGQSIHFSRSWQPGKRGEANEADDVIIKTAPRLMIDRSTDSHVMSQTCWKMAYMAKVLENYLQKVELECLGTVNKKTENSNVDVLP